MQHAVTALIDAARSRFATKAPSNLMAPVSTIAEPTEPTEPTERPTRPSATAPLESPLNTYLSILRHSPLPTAATPAAADGIISIYRDTAVQSAAAACAGKLARLCEMSGFVSTIHAAVECASRDGSVPTSAAVLEALRERIEAIDDALEDWKQDRARHEAASRAHMLRHAPLRAACSARLTQMVAEREHLIAQDDSERRSNRMGLTGSSRYAELRKAGLGEAEIAMVAPGAASPETVVARRSERIAELAGQIKKLNAFTSSAIFDATAIVGIDPAIDAFIVARDGALPTEVAA